MPTPMAESMAEIVKQLAPTLKDARFKKRRHSFNRAADDGIVHVVSFQMGPFEPPGTVEIPPFRLNLYGQFTVNLGVYVPEMGDKGQQPSGKWINEYNCALRKRLGELVPPGQQDIWWSLDNRDAAADDVETELVRHGLPWLDGFGNRQSLLDRFYLFGAEAMGMPPRARIDIALLHRAMGNDELADQELRLHWNDVSDHGHPAHEEYFKGLLKTLDREYVMEDPEVEKRQP